MTSPKNVPKHCPWCGAKLHRRGNKSLAFACGSSATTHGYYRSKTCLSREVEKLRRQCLAATENLHRLWRERDEAIRAADNLARLLMHQGTQNCGGCLHWEPYHSHGRELAKPDPSDIGICVERSSNESTHATKAGYWCNRFEPMRRQEPKP